MSDEQATSEANDAADDASDAANDASDAKNGEANDAADDARKEAASQGSKESSEQAKGPTRCAICGTLVRDAEEVTSCPECKQDYHAACWNEIGGCATYGCKSAAVAQKPAPREKVGGGWGDEKDCPQCKRTIASSLLVCTCGARFPWADPMSPAEYDAWRHREEAAASARKTLIVLFLLSLVGVSAPLCGPIAGIYAFRKRQLLGGANGIYLAIGYGSAALGVAYVGAALALAFALPS